MKKYVTPELELTFKASAASHLLDHLRVLLHYMKEAVTLLGHRRRSFLGAAWKLLEQISNYVVQAGAATSAHHCVCKGREKHHHPSNDDFSYTSLRQTSPARGLQTHGSQKKLLTKCCKPLWYGGQDVHDHMRFQAGDEVHMVLS